MREEIEFIFEPSFSPSLIFHLERDSRGVIQGDVYRKSSDASDSVHRDHLRDFTVRKEVFDELVRGVESAEFKESAERFPIAGADGVAYIFKRHMGNRRLEIRVWCPEMAPTNPTAKIATELSKRFLEVAGASDVSDFKEKKPNSER